MNEQEELELRHQLWKVFTERAADYISVQTGESVPAERVVVECPSWGAPYYDDMELEDLLPLAQYLMTVEGEAYNLEWGLAYHAVDGITEIHFSGPFGASNKSMAAGIRGIYCASLEFSGDVRKAVKAAQKKGKKK